MPSDLQYLTDENIEEIGMRHDAHQTPPPQTAHSERISAGGAMTHVEKMRFQAALQALRGTDSPRYLCLACFLDKRPAAGEGQAAAAAGTE